MVDEVAMEVGRDDLLASGPIQVVTKVARLRSGIPSRTTSSSMSRIASMGGIGSRGISWSGASWVRKLLASLMARPGESLSADIAAS
jgi:hypothetical protein